MVLEHFDDACIHEGFVRFRQVPWSCSKHLTAKLALWLCRVKGGGGVIPACYRWGQTPPLLHPTHSTRLCTKACVLIADSCFIALRLECGTTVQKLGSLVKPCKLPIVTITPDALRGLVPGSLYSLQDAMS